MLKRLLQEYRTRNYFDPLNQDIIEKEDLVKIFSGKVSNPNNHADYSYFIVCKNEIEQLNVEGNIRVTDLDDVVESVFNNSEWFGKFSCERESRIIVPYKYDLSVNPKEKKIWLEAMEGARYCGSGNLQLDKDYSTAVLRTDIGFKEFRELVNDVCSTYRYGYSLQKWNK